MTDILIKNVNIIFPDNVRAGDVHISGGIIARIGEGPISEGRARLIDGSGLYLAPGFVDLHVHFRDPGFTAKEDIESGSRAAARGGYTTVCCMPNTNPAIDGISVLRYIDESARAAIGNHARHADGNARRENRGIVNVFAVGALTRGQLGRELSDIKGMDAAKTLCYELTGHGIAGVSEDGKSLMDEGLMREAMELARSFGLPVMDHAEDAALTGGFINEGEVSETLGIKGIPARAEINIIGRDIRLARETGAHIHIQHVSTKEGAALIREAKKSGVPLTAETAPHYFALTENILAKLPPQRRALAKMNPPLRTESDRTAIIEALKDDTIDAIATDHAPHESAEKALPMDKAPFGVSGLETSFAIAYTELVHAGHLSLPRLIEKLSAAPAALIRLDRGVIAEGKAADLALLDPGKKFVIDSAGFASKGRNTPFDGMEARGKVLMTLRDGTVVYEE